ncbi:hypothetical protein HPP92_021536 [Vanilla planifolia]|uniref:Uncharacterized protein n=1 Tax=Vanilla planifolia TaxID=51239 RepID=A0A835PWS3_VANPL|nr:hypothetical protein HPP92_021536 [Vanilla planifolia]
MTDSEVKGKVQELVSEPDFNEPTIAEKLAGLELSMMGKPKGHRCGDDGSLNIGFTKFSLQLTLVGAKLAILILFEQDHQSLHLQLSDALPHDRDARRQVDTPLPVVVFEDRDSEKTKKKKSLTMTWKAQGWQTWGGDQLGT